jgi:hypothetical protein
MDDIEARARHEAEGVLTYFYNLEKIANFAGESCTEQKRLFLTYSLVNFARAEKLLHSNDPR